MKELEKSLNRVTSRFFKYLVVVFIIIILSFSPVVVSFAEIESGEEAESEKLYSRESSVELEGEELAQYGDPPTNHRTPAQRERAEKILMRWDLEYEDYHTEIAVEISHEEEAVAEIIAEDEDEADYIEDALIDAGANMDNVEFVIMGDDTPERHWIRDYGPVPIIDQDSGNVSFINMEYRRADQYSTDNDFPQNYAYEMGMNYYDMKNEDDIWFVLDGGHKFVEGSGVFYTTNDSYEENEDDLTEEEVEEWVTKWFNLVESDEGFVNVPGKESEHDLFHLDMQVNILNETTVLVSEIEDTNGDENIVEHAELLDETAQIFENATARSGESFDVKRLPMHVENHWYYGYIYYTHSNSLIVNDIVLVPTYNQGTDYEALSIYENATDREIIGIDSSDIIVWTGALHCTTREIPKANIPPSINITEIYAFDNKNVTIQANITVDAGDEDMSSAHVYYNTTGMDDFEKVDMEPIDDYIYEAELGTYEAGTEFDYFIRVEDDYNAVTYEGDVWNPYNETVEARELESIEVTEQPRLEYDSGEALNLNGMNITEYYTDDTTEIVTFGDPEWVENYSATPSNGTELDETHHGQTVTVTHNDTEIENQTGPLTIYTVLDYIEVTVQPRLEYDSGEALNLNGMNITEYYTDDTTEIVTFGDPEWVENYSATPSNGTELDETHHGQTVTVTHNDTEIENQTGPLTIHTVLDYIEVTAQPKLEYDSGEALNLTGMEVTEYYTDNTNQTVTFIDGIHANYTADPSHGIELGDPHHGETVNVTHDDTGVTNETDELIIYPLVENIEVTEQPILEYDSGDNLNLTGMEVTEYYTDDTTETVTFGDSDWEENYTAVPENGTGLGGEHNGENITIIHDPTGVTNETDELIINAVLESIEISTQPELEYYSGEALDLSGMEIAEHHTYETLTVTFGDPEWEKNYTADPEHTNEIDGSHHGNTITVTHENELLTADTNELTVNHELTIDVEGEGSTDPEVGTHSYEHGTTVDLEAVSEENYTFIEWRGDNTTIYNTTATQTSIDIFDNYAITAEFLQDPLFDVEVVDYDEEVIRGEEMVVDYRVTNNGEITDTQDIHFVVYDYFGNEVHSDLVEGVELGDNEVHDDEFIWETEDDDELEDFSFEIWTEDDEEKRDFLVFEEPYFRVTIDEPNDGDEYLEDDLVTVDYTIDNLGGLSDTQDIKFYVGYHRIDVEEGLELEGGHSHSGTFEWHAEEPYGERDITVVSDDDSYSVEIVILEEAYFEVKITEPVYGEEYIDGQTVSIEYMVENTGDATGIQDIMFSIDGNLIETKEELELEGGKIYEGKFTWTASEPYGERDLTVESEDDQDEVTIIVNEAPEEPFFDVYISEPTDGSEYFKGDTVTVVYEVKNLGENSGTQDIEFFVDGVLVDTKEDLELDRGEDDSDTFEWNAEGLYGDLELTVESEDHSDSVTIIVLEEAYFEIEIIEPASGEEYIEGQIISVKYTVENIGDITASKDIDFFVDDDLIETEVDLELEGGKIYEGEFTWTALEPYGERDLTVESEDDQDEVTIIVNEAPEEPFFDVYISEPKDGNEYFKGDTVTVEYKVTNLGENSDTQDINFYVDGNLIEVLEGVELDGGDSHSGTFEWTAEESYDALELTVESEDHSDTVIIKVSYFEVKIIEPIDGKKFIEGDPVTVRYTVENTGDTTDIQHIEFYIDEDLVDIERNLGLQGGEIYEGSFQWISEDPYGERELTVQSEGDYDSVIIQVLEDPFFEVNMTEPITGEDYIEGEAVTIEYSVENIGYVLGEQDIKFYVDDDLVDIIDGVELTGGSTYSRSFTWTAEWSSGDRELRVESDDHFDSVTITVIKDAFFEIEIVDYDDQVTEGEEFFVNYTVENTGELPGTQDIHFIIYDEAGEEVYSEVVEEVRLNESEIYQGNFSWVAEESGEYSFEIVCEAGTHQERTLSVEDTTTPSDGWFTDNCWSYLVIIAAAAMIIGGGLYKKHSVTKEAVIEEVFLISQRNSMLLLHNTRRLRPDRDSDIIAGMFEAVQNFIEDSFQDTGDWELNRLEFGGNKIVVERGEYVYMAVVYEGELSEEEIQDIRDVIEGIEDKFGEQLKEWDGDRKELRGIKDMTQDLFS